MDRFTELSAFLAVVETGGFSSAARQTGSSQSAISKAVGSLEKRLGTILFNRSTRSVTLTDQGQRYYELTRPLIEELDEADSELTSSTLQVSGLIRIATPATFGRLHVLPLIPELLALHPGLKIDLTLSDAVRDMVEDRIDLAIRVGRVDEPDSIVRRVAGTPFVCAGSRRYFKKHGIPRTPADLVDHNCLLYGTSTDTANWAFIGPEGRFEVPVRGNLSSNSIETLRAAVLAGVGIGLFTRLSLAAELRHPDVTTVLNEYVQDVAEVSLIWPKRRFVPARLRRVTDYFAQAIPLHIQSLDPASNPAPHSPEE
jgi:DNA-binding transcriptional LysR family regulator